jgi:hypothetical protein
MRMNISKVQWKGLYEDSFLLQVIGEEKHDQSERRTTPRDELDSFGNIEIPEKDMNTILANIKMLETPKEGDYIWGWNDIFDQNEYESVVLMVGTTPHFDFFGWNYEGGVTVGHIQLSMAAIRKLETGINIPDFHETIIEDE